MLGDIISALGNVGSSLLANAQSERSARRGIRWRVADAKAAGIHPLAALGANIQPVASQPLLGDTGLSALSRIGNNESELSRRQGEAQVRLTEAQTMETLARSRSIANQVRQPVGTTGATPIRGRGLPGEQRGPIDLGERVGRVQPDPRWSSAQRGQDEYGDWFENMMGIPSFMSSLERRLVRARARVRRQGYSDIISRGHRPRDPTFRDRVRRTWPPRRFYGGG